MAEDNRDILAAIKDSGDRTEAAISDLAGEIRMMASAITKGFASARLGAGERGNGNGGMYGIIATFATVIISLGAIFYSQQGSNTRLAQVLDTHQRERLNVFRSHVDDKLFELDEKLQKEISAEAELRDQRFSDAESGSTHRHESQQAELDRIRDWFKAPALREDGR